MLHCIEIVSCRVQRDSLSVLRPRCALFHEHQIAQGPYARRRRVLAARWVSRVFWRPPRTNNARTYGAQSCDSEATRRRAKCAADFAWRRARLTVGRRRACNADKREGLLCDISPPVVARLWNGAISRCFDGGGAG